MMHNLRFLILTLFFVAFSCLEAQSPDENVVRLAKNNNAFAIELYGNLSKGHENICFSPYNISLALAMTYNGAEGNTRKEMGDLLHFSELEDKMNSSFDWMNRYLTAKSTDKEFDFSIDLANSLWIQTGLPILPKFNDTITKYYGPSLERVDFIKQPEESRRSINKWVKENTAGKIENLLSPADLTDATRMVLVSAIYMKAAWAKVFDEKNTKNESFFLSPIKNKLVPMMSNTDKFRYFSHDQFSILEMPYVHLEDSFPELAMLVLLPKENYDLRDVGKRLNADSLHDWISSLKSERVAVSLPRFIVLEKIDLNDVLKEMGMPTAFSNQADFSGITGTQDLKIGKVLHKAFIEVKEQGTEAAASTAVVMKLKSAPPETQKEPIIFRADRPFIYLIYEKKTGAILFLGHVIDPMI